MMEKITFLVSFFLCVVANAQGKKVGVVEKSETTKQTQVVRETPKKTSVIKETAKKPEASEKQDVAKKQGVVKKAEESKKSGGPRKVEVGKIVSGVGIPPLIMCKRAETTYYFTYEDAKDKYVRKEKTFRIEDVDNAFEDLYATIINGFQSMPKKPVMLEIPSGYLWFSYGTASDDPIVKIGHSVIKPKTEEEFGVIDFSHEFTKKQIKKLFGKNI